MKIYIDDPAVPYKTTKVNPRITKDEIERLLARWGIKKAGWDWDPDNGKVSLEFRYDETVNDKPTSQWVRIEPPIIWSRPKKDSHQKPLSEPTINWAVSMRTLFWWLKTHFEMTYLEQFDKTSMFLPFIELPDSKTVREALVPKITRQLLEQPSLEDLR